MQGMPGITPDVLTGFEELEARALETLDEDAYENLLEALGLTPGLCGLDDVADVDRSLLRERKQ